MRRTKEWWSRLTKPERIELVNLERSANSNYRSGRFPDDCRGCGYCSTPHSGYGLCPVCSERLEELIEKGEGR